MRFLIVLLLSQILLSAPIFNQKVREHNGNTIFQSGDEFFNYIHDKDGYPLYFKDGNYYYYDLGQKTDLELGDADPSSYGLLPEPPISREGYTSLRENSFYHTDSSKGAPHQGRVNAITIFIKFADQTEFTNPRSYYDTMFNDDSGNSISIADYYDEISYQKLDISTTLYPPSEPDDNLSYTSSNDRSYYLPYNQYSNPNGWETIREGRLREHNLIKSAVESISEYIPSDLDLDGDDDGYNDYLCLFIRGAAGAWGDVGLWAHSGVLDSYDVSVNGGRFYNYSLQPEPLINPRTICHELFHVLGAPDLYSYLTNFNPTGPWDLMASGSGHMGAWMKYKYSNKTWIEEIPEITESGTYSLSSLYSGPNCYKIRSPYSDDEFFIIENRYQEGIYESELPSSGLAVTRILPATSGNGYSPPFEVYYYRYGGTTTSNGNVAAALLSSNSNRTALNDFNTNPTTFLSDGSPGGLFIENVGEAGETITFDIKFPIITMDSPADDEVFSDGSIINFTISSDDCESVKYYLDGELLTTISSPPFNYDYQITDIANGKHIVSIETLSNGISSTDQKDIYVTDGTALSFFENIHNWQIFNYGESITINPKIVDPQSNFQSIDLYIDDQQYNSITLPHTISASELGYGTKEFKIVTTSNSGVTFTDEITINVLEKFLSEDFEGEWPLEGWDLSSSVYGWYQSKTSPFRGEKSLSTRNYHAQGEVTITSPSFTPTSDTNLSFWWVDKSVDVTKVVGHDSTFCEISSDDINWEVIATLSAPSVETEYHQEIIDLSNWAGEIVRIRFRDVSDETLNAQGTSIDQLIVYNGTSSLNENIVRSQILITNYPNPFNPTTEIDFDSSNLSNFNVDVRNVRGEIVKSYDMNDLKRGENSITFDGSKLVSGVYIVSLISDGVVMSSRKITLIK